MDDKGFQLKTVRHDRCFALLGAAFAAFGPKTSTSASSWKGWPGQRNRRPPVSGRSLLPLLVSDQLPRTHDAPGQPWPLRTEAGPRSHKEKARLLQTCLDTDASQPRPSRRRMDSPLTRHDPRSLGLPRSPLASARRPATRAQGGPRHRT